MFAEIAEVDTTAFEFPNSADVRHALDATLLVEASRGLRVGGAFTYGSGVPYTRLILPDPADESGEVRLGEANAMRTPSYASLDLVAELTRTLGDWEMTGYVQLRNALDRDNRVTYSGSHACSAPRAVASEAGPGCHDGVADRFEAGIPRLPLIGVRFTF